MSRILRSHHWFAASIRCISALLIAQDSDPKIAHSCVEYEPPSWFLGPYPNGISTRSSVFAGLTLATDRQTDHATYVAIDRILCYASRCELLLLLSMHFCLLHYTENCQGSDYEQISDTERGMTIAVGLNIITTKQAGMAHRRAPTTNLVTLCAPVALVFQECASKRWY